MRNPVQRYDWGSLDAIPRLLGVEPDGTPQAELWMGAHPSAPSVAIVEGRQVGLDALIAADPEAALGPVVAARYGGQLPFLVKVLAAARPLSLQAHPTAAQAAAGYAAEEAAAVPREAPNRVYRDPNPKPELLCALGRFEALAGFRPPAEAADVLEAFGVPSSWTGLLRQGRLAETFAALWDLQADGRRAMTARVVAGAAAAASRLPREAQLVELLGRHHPDDPGIVVALMLNRVRLAPGQAVGSRAGRLHAYIEGVGLEIMANSDNVVRGGLTTKPVNLPELRRVAELVPEDVAPLEARPDGHGEAVFEFDTPEFRLSRIELAGGSHDVATFGPEIVVCTDGGADLIGGDRGLALPRGGSAFIPASVGGYRLRGVGTVFRATVGAAPHAT